jgi:hypothetical protein
MWMVYCDQAIELMMGQCCAKEPWCSMWHSPMMIIVVIVNKAATPVVYGDVLEIKGGLCKEH